MTTHETHDKADKWFGKNTSIEFQLKNYYSMGELTAVLQICIEQYEEKIEELEEQIILTWHDSENERMSQIEYDINQILKKHKESIKKNAKK